MEKIENILYSIVPLVLIILFSWLFSFLGSKMRKPQEEPGATSGDDRDPQLVDLMIGQKPTPPGTEPRSEYPDWSAAFPGPTRQSPITKLRSGAPKVTSRPIEPKWWGA